MEERNHADVFDSEETFSREALDDLVFELGKVLFPGTRVDILKEGDDGFEIVAEGVEYRESQLVGREMFELYVDPSRYNLMSRVNGGIRAAISEEKNSVGIVSNPDHSRYIFQPRR